MKSKLTLLGIATLLAAALLLPLTRARADKQQDQAPQTVILAGAFFGYGLLVEQSSSSPGAPTFPYYVWNSDHSYETNLVSLATADVYLRRLGFRLTHISDNQMYRTYEK